MDDNPFDDLEAFDDLEGYMITVKELIRQADLNISSFPKDLLECLRKEDPESVVMVNYKENKVGILRDPEKCKGIFKRIDDKK